jgi:hypothetical protein
MAAQGPQTLLAMLETFRPALTAPGFRNFVALFAGWVRTTGSHAVTAALVAVEVPGRRHHEAFHRFYSRGTWQPDELARLVFAIVLKLLAPRATLHITVDDTLAAKKGPHVFGIGSHLDAVRSTKRQKIFSFGHCWVTLAVVMPVPFSRRTWALPLLFRLYRNEKECLRKGHPHRKKTELARELLDVFHGWVGERRVELSMDAAYCNDTVMRGLPPGFVVFGAMRPDAVLTAMPRTRRRHSNGRPRVRGPTLPKPEALARSSKLSWSRTKAMLYGELQTVEYKLCDAQWYRAAGTRLLRIVVVRMRQGRIPVRVFFCADPTLCARAILEGYSQRWSIEVCFRNLKQLLGFADSSARKQAAVERTAPFVGIVYSVLVLWAVQHASGLAQRMVPLRPWYTHKQGLSFADILRAAQGVLANLDVLDPARGLDNLHQPVPPPPALRFSRRKPRVATVPPPLRRAA